MSFPARYKFTASTSAQVIHGEMVLVNLDEGQYFGLNATGTRITEMLIAEHSVPEIACALAREFTVTEDAASQDVERLVRELLDKRLLAASPR